MMLLNLALQAVDVSFHGLKDPSRILNPMVTGPWFTTHKLSYGQSHVVLADIDFARSASMNFIFASTNCPTSVMKPNSLINSRTFDDGKVVGFLPVTWPQL